MSTPTPTAPTTHKEPAAPATSFTHNGIRFTNVESSNIAAVAYSKGDVYIKFNKGAIYKYEAVPQKIFDALLNSHSKGVYFSANIKPHYKASKV